MEKENIKLLRQLIWRTLCASKMRNFMSISAITLTTILMTSLFTMFFGITENIQENLMRVTGSSAHVLLKNITDQQYNLFKQDYAIQQIGYARNLCDQVNNKEFSKRKAEFWYYDDTTLDMSYIQLSGGRFAKEANEIMIDTVTLQLLGIIPKEGAELTLNLVIHGEEVERKFVVAGWWEANKLQPVSLILASPKYLDTYREELSNQKPYRSQRTGMAYAYVKFNQSFGLELKCLQLLQRKGFTNNLEHNNYPYIATGINWAYLSTEVELSFSTLAMLLAVILLIGCSGYLIISNIFQISIQKDIHFYGLLKVIGTTTGQSKKIVWGQVFALSLVGLPIGLLLGFFMGSYIVPYVMGLTGIRETPVSLPLHPLLFLFSAGFALFTVCVSARKAVTIVAKISPIEAVRYQETDKFYKKTCRRTKNGAKMYRMAFSNLIRNPKTTGMVLLSLSFSAVIFHIVFLLSTSFDLNKFLDKYSLTDFEVSHVDLQNARYSGKENSVSEEMIQYIQNQPWYQNGGRICLEQNFTDLGNRDKTRKDRSIELEMKEYTLDPYIYGLDPYIFNQLELIEGSIDQHALESGTAVLLGVKLDDNGKPEMDSIFYQIGDIVTLNITNKNMHTTEKREVKIIGFVKQHSNLQCGYGSSKTDMETNIIYWNPSFYIPMSFYQELYPKQAVMSFLFDVKSGQEEAMEKFLIQYTQQKEPFLLYHSKQLYQQEFSQLKTIFLLIGGAFTIIIGMIGIVNFINTFSANLLFRRQEFAVLESIGMTKRQLNRMLLYEGIYYVAGICFLSICFGLTAIPVIMKPLSESFWFLSYLFTLWPLWIPLSFFILLGIGLPRLLYYWTNKGSIMVRMKKM